MTEIKLPKTVVGRSKRLGRGYGSGKGGHTSSRGQKGQKSRGSLGILFEGLKVRKSLLHRLPFHRGKTKFAARPKPLVIPVDVLNLFNNGDKVNVDSLIAKGIVRASEARSYGVKILGGSALSKKVIVELELSSSARKAIESAGGTVNQGKK